MEKLIPIMNFLILGLIIVLPIIILFVLKRLNTKRTLIIYFLISLFILGVLIWIFAWWSDKFAMILLDHFGYNYNGFDEIERFHNVAPENIDKVTRLETSIMGIGWPLKAMFEFLITIPYLIFIYMGKVLIERLKP